MARHSFITPDVAESVMLKQARQRRDLDDESTWIHYHKMGSTCNDKCKLISPEIEEQNAER